MTDKIKSPCVEVCNYDSMVEHCATCGRTLQEIADWSSADHDRKKTIKQSAKKRLKKKLDMHQQK